MIPPRARDRKKAVCPPSKWLAAWLAGWLTCRRKKKALPFKVAPLIVAGYCLELISEAVRVHACRFNHSLKHTCLIIGKRASFHHCFAGIERADAGGDRDAVVRRLGDVVDDAANGGWAVAQGRRAFQDLDALHPLGGTGTPDDIAWGAVNLASDESRWVTGAELVIDGGYTAR